MNRRLGALISRKGYLDRGAGAPDQPEAGRSTRGWRQVIMPEMSGEDGGGTK